MGSARSVLDGGEHGASLDHAGPGSRLSCLVGWLLPPTKQRRAGFPTGPGGAPAMWPSIATKSARRHDGSEFIEIEIDDGEQRRGGSGVAEAIWQGVVPGGVFGLQRE